jgi:uncharacterized protein (TIGR02246 family)
VAGITECFLLDHFIIVGPGKRIFKREGNPMSKDQDIAAIKSVMREYETALGAGDLSRLVSIFTHDAVVIPGVASAVRGREAIESWYQNALAQFTAKQTTKFDELEVTGDSAFLRLSFTTAFTAKPSGEPTEVKGKAMGIYNRQADGSWKAARVMWISDKPLPVPSK